MTKPSVASIRCPKCGCRPQYVTMRAQVKCLLTPEGHVGKTVWVGSRIPTGEYPKFTCGGGHEFSAPVKPLPAEH